MKTIVICGATGQQGGAVLDSLLDGDFKLIALSRNPNSGAARAIQAKGVEVRQADLDDLDSLIRAFTGAYGVYGVTTPLTGKGKMSVDQDRQQGLNIVDACLATGIEHLVLSTILLVDERQESIPYLRGKLDVEAYLREKNIPHTILGPSSFMDDLGGEFLPVKKGRLTGMADRDAKIPYVACRDIGIMARIAFEHPDRHLGDRINIVGDFISGDELVNTLHRISKGEVRRYKVPPKWLMHLFARTWLPLREAFESWGRAPYPESMMKAIIDSKKLNPEMMSFEQYILQHGYKK